MGASNSVNVSSADLGRTSCAVKKLVNSINRLIAVLSRRASMSSVTDGHGPGHDLGLFDARRNVLDLGVEADLVGVRVHDHPPGPRQESIDALHSLHAPGLDRFQRTHEHLIESQAVGAIFLRRSRPG